MLKVKDKYKNSSIQNKRFGKIDLSILPESLYKFYNENGLGEYFEEEVKEVKSKPKSKKKNEKIEPSPKPDMGYTDFI